MKKIKTSYFWYAFVVFAFASALSFVQINSYGADKNHTNTLFRVLFGAFLALAITCVIMVANRAGGGYNKNKG